MTARNLVLIAIAALLTAAPGCVRSPKLGAKLGANPAAVKAAGEVSNPGQNQNRPIAAVVATNGAAIEGVVRAPAASVMSNHAAGIIGTNGAALAGQAATMLANNGAGLVGNNTAGLVGNNTAGLVGNNTAGLVASNTARFRAARRLAAAPPGGAPALVPIADAPIELFDLRGNRVSTTPARTGPDGRFTFPVGTLAPSSGPLVARAVVQLAGRTVTIEALLPAGAATAAGSTLALGPASSLVAKKARAVGADGSLAAANLGAQAAQALADALAPFLSERGAVAALLLDAADADLVFDALAAASPTLAGQLADASARTGGGALLRDAAPGGPAPLAPPGTAPDAGTPPSPAGSLPASAQPSAPATSPTASPGGRRGGGGSSGGGPAATPTPAPTPTPPADAQVGVALAEPYYLERIGGSGAYGSAAGTSALSATFGQLTGLAGASDGTLYVADGDHHQIRRVPAAGAPTLLAGQADAGAGFAGDGLPASDARLSQPLGLHYDERRDYLLVCDHVNNRIRGFAPGGRIATIVGGGTDPGEIVLTPLSAQLDGPAGLAVDPDGWLFFTERGRARYLPPGGQLQTLGPIGEGTGAYPIASDPGRDLVWYADGDQIRVVTDVRGVPTLAPAPTYVVPAAPGTTMRVAGLATDRRGGLWALVREDAGGFPRGVQVLRLPTGPDGQLLAGREAEAVAGSGTAGTAEADYVLAPGTHPTPLAARLPAVGLSGLWLDLTQTKEPTQPAETLFLGLANPTGAGPAGMLLRLVPGEAP